MAEMYYIRNVGCDDETVGLTVMAHEVLYWFKNLVDNLNKNSTYKCMPTIEIYKIDESFIRPATKDDDCDGVMYFNGNRYVLAKSIWEYNYETKNFNFAEGVEKVC